VATPLAPLNADDKVGPIVLAKMPVNQVLELLQTYSGRVFIPSAGLPKAAFSFTSSGELSRNEAILALETLLNLNGVMLIQQGDKFIQAVPSTDALRRGPAMLEEADGNVLPEQQVYGRIFEFKHLDSRTMYLQVRNLLSPGGVSSILELNWRDALLIFDTAHNLAAVANVIEMLDQPPQQRAEVFILTIKNSSVYSVYNALIHAQRSYANEALYKARFLLDRQANHLVVVAPPESKAYIEELIETLDREIAPLTTSQIFTIRKGSVRTVYSILAGIIRHQQTWFARQGFQSPETYRLTQEVEDPSAAAPAEGPAPDAPPPSVEVVLSDLADASAELQFSPYMGIWIDLQNNALVAYGTPADMKRAAALIEQLDQESVPYTASEIIPLKHAFAPGIGTLLNHMVQVQRGMFAREGQASGEVREGQGGDLEDAFEFSPYMYIWSERASNAVLVYGTRNDIDRIKAIIEKLDIAQSPITRSKTVAVKHTQASTCATLLSRIIYLQRYAFMREGLYTGETRSGATPQTGAAEGAGMETGFEFTPYALVTADRTSNSLFIYGTERDIQRVEELLADLDRETAPITKSKVYYLKHADAYSLGRIISQVIDSQRRTFQSRGLRSEAEDPMEAARQEAEITMGFEFSDFAAVVADRRSNSILLYGTDSDIVRVDAIIQETDIPVEPITTSQVFALKYADANGLSRMLQIIVSSQRRAMREVESASEKVRNAPGGKDGQGAVEGSPAVQFSQFLSIVPDSRNNALIVYGTDSDVENVAELVKQTDVEVVPLTRSEVFFLENASSRTLASMLTTMIRNQQAAMRLVQDRFRAVQYPGADKEEEAFPAIVYDSSQSMQFSPYVSVVANERSNSLLVYGTESDITHLRGIVEQNDIAVAPRTQSRVYYIKHADAIDVVRTITPLITAQQRVRERESTLRRIFRDRTRDGEDPESGGALETGAGAPEALPEPSEMGLEFDEDLQFSPYITLSADERSNSIITYGTPFDLEQIETLILQIDRVLPQVQIEVVIAEVMLQDGQVSGLDSFGISYDNPFPFQIDGAANGGVASRGGVLGTTPALDTGNGAGEIGIGLNPFSIQSVFRTAEENSKVRILSAPTITTSHNRPASINVGEARPIITSSTSTLNNSGTTRSTVEYRDIGIELKVRPLVSDQGYIQMDIEQVVETVIDTQTIDNNEQPIIGTRRAISFVSVRDEQIIVMGGLQSEATIVSEGKVWILGDIPLLGRLFRPKKNTSTVRELIIFIRPKLVKDMGAAELIARQKKTPGAVGADVVSYFETGHFPGQIPAETAATNATVDVKGANDGE
jgi:type II secretion system protein D